MKKILSFSLAIALLVTSLFSTSQAQGEREIMRLAGENRYVTAKVISVKTYRKADTIILADGSNFPDALAGGQLAMALNAPILLVDKNHHADGIILGEARRLGAKNAIILGGKNSVNPVIEEKLKQIVQVERIAGKNRYETCQKIFDRTKQILPANEVVIASGANYPDALAASNYMKAKGALLLLSDGKMPATSLKAVAVGGTKTLPLPGETIERIAGKDRYETSEQIAEKTFPEAKTLILANGENYPDALTAASLVNVFQGPLVLTKQCELSEAVKAHLEKGVNKVILVGGKASLCEEMIKEIKGVSHITEEEKVRTNLAAYVDSIELEKIEKIAGEKGAPQYEIPGKEEGLPILKGKIMDAKKLLEKEEWNEEDLKEAISLNPVKHETKDKFVKGLADGIAHGLVVDWEVQGERNRVDEKSGKKYPVLEGNTIFVKTVVKDLSEEDYSAYFNIVYEKDHEGVDTVSTSTPKYKKEKLDEKFFHVEKTEDGLRFVLNTEAQGYEEAMKDVLILKPIIKITVANKTKMENGDLVFVK